MLLYSAMFSSKTLVVALGRKVFLRLIIQYLCFPLLLTYISDINTFYIRDITRICAILALEFIFCILPIITEGRIRKV